MPMPTLSSEGAGAPDVNWPKGVPKRNHRLAGSGERALLEVANAPPAGVGVGVPTHLGCPRMIVIEAPSEGHVGFPRVACEEALFLGAGQRGPQEIDTRKEEALLKPKRVPGPQTDRRRACSDERAPQRRSILVRNKDLVACFTGVAGALDVTRDAQRITFERRPPKAPNVGTFAEDGREDVLRVGTLQSQDGCGV